MRRNRTFKYAGFAQKRWVRSISINCNSWLRISMLVGCSFKKSDVRRFPTAHCSNLREQHISGFWTVFQSRTLANLEAEYNVFLFRLRSVVPKLETVTILAKELNCSISFMLFSAKSAKKRPLANGDAFRRSNRSNNVAQQFRKPPFFDHF